MSDCFDFHAGTTPLLISIPHDGRLVPTAIADRLTARARELPDTDWHVRKLYAFSKSLGASVIAANYSRYVVDLNRSDTDEALYEGRIGTGLFPAETFDGEGIYLDAASLDAEEKRRRVDDYWRPYHDKIESALDELKERFGYALLWDAHSIRSQVPSLFDGLLPELNFGANDGRSCASDVIEAVVRAAGQQYTVVLDERFKGGYITRQYGRPGLDVHAIQLELAQRCYMDEDTRKFDDQLSAQLQTVLTSVLTAYLASAEQHYGVGQ